MEFKEMTFEEWESTFKPVSNHIVEGSSFDGKMFETYDREVEFVKAQPAAHIWTYGDGDSGAGYIWSGWHFVNRLGYFITELPCPEGVEIQIKVSDPCYFCEGCETEHDDPENAIWEKYGEYERCNKCCTDEQLKQLEASN